MADELERLRLANPVRADEGPWRDRPLDDAAERRLNLLMRGEPRTAELSGNRPRERARAGGWPGRRPSLARRFMLSAAATATAAVLVVVTLTVVFSEATTAPAAAAPTALVPRAGSRPVPLAEIAQRAWAAADGSTAPPRRGSHFQAWYVSLEVGADAAAPVTLPQERVIRWSADGSGTDLTVATDPRRPGEPVIDDSGGRARPVADGKVIERTEYPAGTRLPGDEPPDEPAALRTYLTRLHGPTGTTGTTTELLDDLSALLRTWTPGPRGHAAIATLLSRTEGLRPAGAVTDRLGRRGQAYTHRSGEARYMVVLSPEDGRVLGVELTAARDQPEFRLRAGDVLSYEAWLP
ncbi:CU044_5270 family protein [Streptomyces sp. LX-29]|uniref:CU044_5270 family protein n=1 Tax=Streptomyces sp. LX-29 TaxID=2900152 RepID=UPI00240E0AC0|nr:CU044_5270 family protein [Streptomyces sp. LX-29]WFB08297.1 CU044_5270 family protein [Streptomyces sp. LX-29]